MPQHLLLQDLTAQSLALGSGAVSSQALTDAVLAEIERRQPRLNAYLHIDAAGARRAAAESDARRAAGRSLGALDGLTLALKDNIDAAGLPTSAGMATRRGRLAGEDAFVVRQLRQAGMVVVGKLNMHEAALGATTDNPHFGRCEHPLRAGFTPGGSSGGSACAVAAGLCAMALGSDTMGSVRIPAAYCGVVGFKASYGLVSTAGTVACCYALDHIGPLLRSRRDLQLVLPVIAVFDADCPDARRYVRQYARQIVHQEVRQEVHQSVHHDSHAQQPAPAQAAPRFVAVSDVQAIGATPEVASAYQRALQALRERGNTVTEIALAGYDFGRARRAGLVMVEADLLLVHAQDWREQPHNFSPELARFMRYGERQSAVDLAAALRCVAGAQVEVARWFANGEVMLLPTAPQTAFAFGAAVPANQADLTSLANMTGVPALSAPLPVAAGELPISLQLLAPAGADATLLNLDLQGVCSA